MNCFDLQNRASDFLDGNLIGGQKTEADQHLDDCRDCSERYKRYRIILTSISSQPRSALPIPIRKSPMSAGIPRLDIARLRRSRWDRIPWYIRTTLEGVGIVLMILLGISAGPRLRAIYERSIEANLEDFTQSFREWRESSEHLDSTAPLARGKTQLASVTSPDQPQQVKDNFSSGDSETDNDSATSDDEDDDSTPVEGGGGNNDASEVHAGHNEIWRFMIKTDSPHEIRPRIVKLLTDLNIPSNTPGIGGTEAPGGIQFDLLVPPEVVGEVKKQLQAMAPKAPIELAKTPAGETFTWYMNKAKTKLPEHKTRIVIWLSQM